MEPLQTNEEQNPNLGTTDNQPMQPMQPEPVMMPPKKRSRWPLWTALALVLTALLAIAGYWVWTNYFKPEPKVVKNDIPVVRWALPEKGLRNFYPNISIDNVQLELNRQVFEGLVGYEGLTTIAPKLATSWTNPDDSTWLFTLASNVKFHTGRTMRAEDVRDSIMAAKDTEIGETFASTIKDVTVTSDGKIQITTDGPDPVLLNKLTYLYIYDTQGDTNDPANGTGAYQLKPGTTATDTEVTLVAFDDYHGGRPYVRELDVTYMAREDQGAAYERGDIDIATIDSSQYAKDVTKSYGTIGAPSLNVALLGLNVNREDSPLTKRSVREALYLATDVPALLKVRQLDGTPIGQLVPEEIPGYNPDIARPKRDVAKAMQLLKDAGYEDGVTLKFTYFAAAQSTAEEIARQLAEAGITLTLDPQTEPSKLAAIAFGGQTDLYFVTNSSDTLDAMEVYSTFYQGANYESEEINSLIAEGNKTFDAAKRLSILKQIAKLGADDIATIPLYTGASTISIHNPAYRMQVDVPGVNLGVYFYKVYSGE